MPKSLKISLILSGASALILLGLFYTPSLVAAITIGDVYQGGAIAYIDSTGLAGLIAAPSDQAGSPQYNQLTWNDAKKSCNDLVLNSYIIAYNYRKAYK